MPALARPISRGCLGPSWRTSSGGSVSGTAWTPSPARPQARRGAAAAWARTAASHGQVPASLPAELFACGADFVIASIKLTMLCSALSCDACAALQAC